MENFESMDDKKMKELMLDHIDGRLTGELKDFVSKHIEKNPEAKKEYEEMKQVADLMKDSPELEPKDELKAAFMDELSKEMEAIGNEIKGLGEEFVELSEEMSKGEAKVIGLNLNFPLKVAASVGLVLLGTIVGILIMQQYNRNEAIMAELEQTKQLLMMSLQQESASQRIMGVNYSEEISELDAEVTAVLINTMNNDENVNVRLAAVEALANFIDSESVRVALINALGTQKNPLVQTALINIMVNKEEKSAVDKLRDIIHDPETIESVKDEAQMGLYKLM